MRVSREYPANETELQKAKRLARKFRRDEKRSMVALDPGVRTFKTTYSPHRVGKYCSGNHGFNKVFELAEKCDETIGRLADDSLGNHDRKKLLRTKNLLIERQKNLVTELHRKVALDLCNNYDTILIPTFETSQMTKKHDPYKNTRRKIKLMS